MTWRLFNIDFWFQICEIQHRRLFNNWVMLKMFVLYHCLFMLNLIILIMKWWLRFHNSSCLSWKGYRLFNPKIPLPYHLPNMIVLQLHLKYRVILNLFHLQWSLRLICFDSFWGSQWLITRHPQSNVLYLQFIHNGHIIIYCNNFPCL